MKQDRPCVLCLSSCYWPLKTVEYESRRFHNGMDSAGSNRGFPNLGTDVTPPDVVAGQFDTAAHHDEAFQTRRPGNREEALRFSTAGNMSSFARIALAIAFERLRLPAWIVG